MFIHLNGVITGWEIPQLQLENYKSRLPPGRTTSTNFIVIECAGLFLATETLFRKSNNIDPGKIEEFPTSEFQNNILHRLRIFLQAGTGS